MSEPEFEDIPGTLLFDADRSRQGYHLNMFCMSLMKPENREAFRADEEGYKKKFPMTPEQSKAITSKLGAFDGLSFQALAAKMTGKTQQEYVDMMLAGGRSVEGNRSKSEWKNRG
jgi:protocatechuate 4,5-dioxygenase alpha chain